MPGGVVRRELVWASFDDKYRGMESLEANRDMLEPWDERCDFVLAKEVRDEERIRRGISLAASIICGAICVRMVSGSDWMRFHMKIIAAANERRVIATTMVVVRMNLGENARFRSLATCRILSSAGAAEATASASKSSTMWSRLLRSSE